MKKSTLLYASMAFVILTVLLSIWVIASDEEDGWKKVSGKAKDFTMMLFDGKIINSTDLKGKVIILEFWDTHCGPCLQLMPELVKLSDKYKDNPDVAIYIINAGWEKSEQAKAYIERKNYQFNSAYMNKDISRRLGVTTLPATIIIDKDYNLRFKHLGFDENNEMDIVSEFDTHIQTLLK